MNEVNLVSEYTIAWYLVKIEKTQLSLNYVKKCPRQSWQGHIEES